MSSMEDPAEKKIQFGENIFSRFSCLSQFIIRLKRHPMRQWYYRLFYASHGSKAQYLRR